MNSPFRRFSNVLEPFSEASPPLTFEWELDGLDLLLRPHGGDVQTVWAYLGRRDIAAKMLKPRTLRTSGNRVRGAFHARRLWRVWPLENGETVFLRGEFGLWRRGEERELTRFELPKKAFKTALEAFEASGERFAGLVGELEGEEQSDFNEARRWKKQHESPWDCLEFRRGSREELELLLHAMAPLFLDPDKEAWWMWTPRFRAPEGSLDLRQPLAPFLLHWSKASQSAAERIGAAMEKSFEVHVEKSPWRGYDLRGNPTSRSLPTLRFASGSMHDRLEAMMTLRDWLRDKVPRHEIEELLEAL